MFDRKYAEEVAKRFWESKGNNPGSLQCLRFGQNGMFVDRDSAQVLRVHRPTRSISEVSKEVALVEHLDEVNFPSTRLSSRYAPQPVVFDESIITIWELEHDTGAEKNLGELGTLIRAFHEAVADASESWPPLPWIDISLERLERYMSDSRFDSATIGSINKRVEQLQGIASGSIKSELGWGIVHGDAHIGNVISGAEGLVLADFERVCVSAREWDAIPTVVAIRRFGNDEKQLRSFASTFHNDLLDHEFLDDMCEVREWFMLTALMEQQGSSKRIDEAINWQTSTLLNGDRIAQWEPLW